MSMKTQLWNVRCLSAAAVFCFAACGMGVAQDSKPILKQFKKIETVASTVPSNGDVNPYGIVVIPETVGKLTAGDLLISNFNNSGNSQGTGTTIVEISPEGSVQLFAQLNASTLPGACPGGLGLTTALAVTRSGWVIVGSLPTSDGTAATAQAGCLIVLDKNGTAVETFYGSLINGPWDMTSVDLPGQTVLFVTNVLNGTVAAGGQAVNGGTVVRIVLNQDARMSPTIESMTVVGSGFAQRTDPAALVIGPTGVAFSQSHFDGDKDGGLLYVADTLNNRIAIIPDALRRNHSAGIGVTLTSGGSLNAPLGLITAPNGEVLAVNGADGYATEITPFGWQIAKRLLDSSGTPPGGGALFGLVLQTDGLYYVDDATNTLNLLK
jgi:hypothetical protein